MKILFTLHNIACRGGSERVVINLANELCEIPNYEVSIISYYTDTSAKEPYAYPINPKVNVSYLHEFDDIHKNFRGLKRILWRLVKPLIINYRMNIYIYKGYDIVIESDFAFFYPRFRLKNTKYIKIMHSVIKKWKKKNNLFDCIVFLNEKELLKLQSSCKHVIKIPNFIPSQPYIDLLPKAISYLNEVSNKDLQNVLQNFKAESSYKDIQSFKQARFILQNFITHKFKLESKKYTN